MIPRSSSAGRASLRDVAEAAGVSRAAVSLVLNGKAIRIGKAKRQGIVKAAHRLGYVPHAGARRLARQRMETLALLFPHTPAALSHIYLFELMREIADCARTFRHDVLLDFHAGDPREYCAGSGRTDGTIVVANPEMPRQLVRILEQARHPHVVMGGTFLKPPALSYVDCNLREGSRQVARHLVRLGHRRIAFVAAVLSPDKFRGYREALSAAKIRADPSLVVRTGLSEEDAIRAVDRLFKQKLPPTAVMAANDVLAIRIIHALQRRGIHVPREVSVAGFDDVETAALMTPSLTTARIPIRGLAEAAVRNLIRLIENPSGARARVLLPTKLVVRDSTGPAPRKGA